ncbi:hypothetical protein [Bradyrhizobium barranii]|uniref:hypothetical protein n=1 Tax=Bradyrhizobium barranii TaxID=2992140 RepID=UPI003D15F979
MTAAFVEQVTRTRSAGKKNRSPRPSEPGYLARVAIEPLGAPRYGGRCASSTRTQRNIPLGRHVLGRKNIFAISSPGASKSVMLMRKLISYRGGAVVLDVRGSFTPRPQVGAGAKSAGVLAIQGASAEACASLFALPLALSFSLKGDLHDRCRHSSMRRSYSESCDRREIHPRARGAGSARRHWPDLKSRYPGNAAQDPDDAMELVRR